MYYFNARKRFIYPYFVAKPKCKYGVFIEARFCAPFMRKCLPPARDKFNEKMLSCKIERKAEILASYKVSNWKFVEPGFKPRSARMVARTTLSLNQSQNLKHNNVIICSFYDGMLYLGDRIQIQRQIKVKPKVYNQ